MQRNLGFGIGLRSRHFNRFLHEQVRVDWVEAITETYMGVGGKMFAVLEKVRKDMPVALHGVSLSIGSDDPLNPHYLAELRSLSERIEPVIVSDHLCWGSLAGRYGHDLWPLPNTQETIEHIVRRVSQVQELLGRPLLLENISTYGAFRADEMCEWEFVAEVARRAGCKLLLDINNIYVNSVNHTFNPFEYLQAIPVDHVGQFHVAGHLDKGGYLLDAHNDHVCQAVWQLYQTAVRRFGSTVPTLVEWDDHIPSLEVLIAETDKARVLSREVLDREAIDREVFSHEVKTPTSATTLVENLSVQHAQT